ncbi:MAG: glycoside hydrolase family 3 protein [Bacteroidetes bacterium]|nr:MAG: glycoside hydrolase family 3 protein [Bacteroidota bacterium]
MNFLLPKLIAISFCFLLNTLLFAQPEFPFQDPKIDSEERISDLLERLTLKEKTAMMLYNSPGVERLGIPPYNWWNESLHGIGRAGKATVFPQAIGLAATFDEDLIYRVASAISDEARAKHNAAIAKGSYQQYTGLSFWTPNINIFRDPRWGRGQETYGEDPFLTAKLGVAYVEGLQGDHPKYLKAAACAKHFVVHSGPEATRHEFNAVPDEIDFRETYLPAFKKLVEAEVETVMCAYNQLFAEPCCGNKMLLQSILRDEWGFKGHIVSDCWALMDFISHQKVAKDGVEAAAMAAEAGVNLNCGTVYQNLHNAVEGGDISEARIDELLKPLLNSRIKLGLLDYEDQSPYANISPEILNSEEHRQLAWEAAAKSIVLLKNDKGVLPLNSDTIQKIFVTGPTAFDNMVLIGNYNGFSGNLVTLVEGMINKSDEGTIVEYAMGTLLNTETYHGYYHAQSSDVTIAAIGNSRMLEGEEGDAMLTDSGDRTDIRLPENQIELIRRIKKDAPDKPLIVVVTGGSAVALPEIAELADALLFVWYPGEQGGNAIADVIYGNMNPSGRLPVTFYKGTEDLPPFDDYSMRNRTYRYFKGDPLFPFGHGLSYSDFAYEDLAMPSEGSIEDETIEIEFFLTNTSIRSGEEVVQVYVKKPQEHFQMPIKSLVGVQHVWLTPGQKTLVTISIDVADLASWDLSTKQMVINPGAYQFEVGASSASIKLKGGITLE